MNGLLKALYGPRNHRFLFPKSLAYSVCESFFNLLLFKFRLRLNNRVTLYVESFRFGWIAQGLKPSSENALNRLGPIDQPGRSSGLHPEGREFKSRSVHQSLSILLRSNFAGTILTVGTRRIPNKSWFSSNLLLASSALNHFHHFLLRTAVFQSSKYEKISSYSKTTDCLLPQRLILYVQNRLGPRFTQLVDEIHWYCILA